MRWARALGLHLFASATRIVALRAHYKGETGIAPWRDMGFKTRAAMENVFAAFLENPGQAPR